MKMVYHAANTRGAFDHGWLKSKHSFSFASYYNPARMGFGALRVINDDEVVGGQGFGAHPHRNMEIVSIPLSGKLNHHDNMGHQGVIAAGEIQVMSAGTGITHSEMNGDPVQPLNFLQIWILPNKMNVSPRYQQINLTSIMQPNQFNQVLSPNPKDNGVWLHQEAWFNLGEFDQNISPTYKLHNVKHGVYLFVITGEIVVHGQALSSRDGLGVWDTKELTIDIIEKAQVLLIEVPLSSSM